MTSVPTSGDAEPGPWISAMVVSVGSGSGSGVVAPLFCGVTAVENEKSATLLSVSTKLVRFSDPGVALVPS